MSAKEYMPHHAEVGGGSGWEGEKNKEISPGQKLLELHKECIRLNSRLTALNADSEMSEAFRRVPGEILNNIKDLRKNIEASPVFLRSRRDILGATDPKPQEIIVPIVDKMKKYSHETATMFSQLEVDEDHVPMFNDVDQRAMARVMGLGHDVRDSQDTKDANRNEWENTVQKLALLSSMQKAVGDFLCDQSAAAALMLIKKAAQPSNDQATLIVDRTVNKSSTSSFNGINEEMANAKKFFYENEVELARINKNDAQDEVECEVLD
jgi:hypothetical protein